VTPDSIIIPPPIKTKEAGKVVKRISHLFFSIQNGICITRIIEGDFPEYTEFIPKSCPSRIEVDRKTLLQSLKRIKHISTDPACHLLVDGSLELLIKDEEEGIECRETVPGELKGQKTDVNINPNILHDCLAGLVTETVLLYFQGPGKPMLVEDPRGWFGLVMPLMSEN
jgi:DNA polymerase-3 subunit beta